jgi:hypothetical protein
VVGGFSGVYASGPSAASHGTQRVESMSVDVENRFRTVRTFYPKRRGGLHWFSNAEPPELAVPWQPWNAQFLSTPGGFIGSRRIQDHIHKNVAGRVMQAEQFKIPDRLRPCWVLATTNSVTPKPRDAAARAIKFFCSGVTRASRLGKSIY